MFINQTLLFMLFYLPKTQTFLAYYSVLSFENLFCSIEAIFHLLIVDCLPNPSSLLSGVTFHCQFFFFLYIHSLQRKLSSYSYSKAMFPKDDFRLSMYKYLNCNTWHFILMYIEKIYISHVCTYIVT